MKQLLTLRRVQLAEFEDLSVIDRFIIVQPGFSGRTSAGMLAGARATMFCEGQVMEVEYASVRV